MAKDYSKAFYKSKPYRSSREQYIQKRIDIDGGLCEHCKERVGSELDHIIELNENNITQHKIALDHNNFQWLCHDCHTRKTKTKRRVLGFDSEGQPIIKE